MGEVWRPVVDYESWYEVSNLGRVRSVDHTTTDSRGQVRRFKGRILSSGLDSYGYPLVVLCKQGTQQSKRVHQLVAEAWIGPCPSDCEVRHGPNGATDNSVGNLCYGTCSENHFDRRRDGTHGGRAVRRSDGVEFINMHVAAEETDCQSAHICSVCRGRRKIAGDYGWEYI